MLQQMGIKLVKKKTALKIVAISSRKQHNCLLSFFICFVFFIIELYAS